MTNDQTKEQLSPNQSTLPKSLIEAAARDWDCSFEQMERLAMAIDARGGSMTGNDKQDLDLVAVAYSKACEIHECSSWLPFNLMPGWEDDVFCILEDEDAWFAVVNAGESVAELAARLKGGNQ